MISTVLVSYRTAALARAAIGDLRAQAEEAGLALEVIAVVNSGDAAEASALESVAERVFLPDRNLGYAGGLNLGIAASSGELLLLSNPDVRLRPGALAALVAAARAEAFAAVGPVFYLDPGASLLVPPFDEPHPFSLARRRLAFQPRRTARLVRRDLARAGAMARAAAEGTRLVVPALPGALVAVTRAAFERVGPFDEGYRLYYEENDWERRLRRLGGGLVIAGGAHVVHRYGRSTRTEPQAAAWFAESERRYFRSHFGRWGERALDALQQASPFGGPEPPLLEGGRLSWDGVRDVAVLVSPQPEMRPFAFARPASGVRSWSVPGTFVAELAEGETWYARAVTLPAGTTLAEGRIVRPARAAGA